MKQAQTNFLNMVSATETLLMEQKAQDMLGLQLRIFIVLLLATHKNAVGLYKRQVRATELQVPHSTLAGPNW